MKGIIIQRNQAYYFYQLYLKSKYLKNENLALLEF